MGTLDSAQKRQKYKILYDLDLSYSSTVQRYYTRVQRQSGSYFILTSYISNQLFFFGAVIRFNLYFANNYYYFLKIKTWYQKKIVLKNTSTKKKLWHSE